ncbi:Cysteine desulfurase IscS 2 [uncultured archaeon]|nr:Cysteine desulfurase IscS 2 [uncultured archaeon]
MEKLYLDNAATTPLAKEVVQELNKKISLFGNPSSRHVLGREAKIEIEKAREKIAKSINAKPEEIIFTSGATESNNLAIKGLAEANPTKKQIITSEIEHPSILEVCKNLGKRGYQIDKISVDSEGIINLKELKDKISKDALLVSVMHVNNEIGTIQPIEEIAKICKEKNVPFHTDAVQSFGKLKIDVQKIGINLLSASGHKLNALKGIGFLYVKRGMNIEPQLNGGGQENNLRSGTENVLGIISLAKAIELKRESEKVEKSRDKIINKLLEISGSKLNGSKEKRIYNNINISFYGIEGESLQMFLDEEGIFISTSSACASNKLAKSHVLKAIGIDKMYLNGSIRITLDTLKLLTTKQEDFIIKKIKENVEKLQKISPFKFQEDKK